MPQNYTSDTWFHPSLRRSVPNITEAEDLPLEEPRFDPVTALANLYGVGGLVEGLANLGIQGIGAAALGGEEPKHPSLAMPDWYKAESRMANRKRWGIPETAPLNQHYGPYTGELTSEQRKYIPGEGYPEYYSRLPELHPVGGNAPNPSELIYHGLSTDLQETPEYATNKALQRLYSIQQTGLSRGWFSPEPHAPFGPLYLATKQYEQQPPGYPSYPKESNKIGIAPRKGAFIDPDIELVPQYDKPVAPHELYLVDHRGNLLGRLGDPNAPRLSEIAQEQAAKAPMTKVPVKQMADIPLIKEMPKQLATQAEINAIKKYVPNEMESSIEHHIIMNKGLGMSFDDILAEIALAFEK